MTDPKFIKTGHCTKIAYHKTPGRGPGVVFLGGFMSDMEGSKALALEEVCKTEGRAFVRFDYAGHGQSAGRFEDGTIGQWKDDALAVLDQLTQGSQILVGSSMGGWIAMLVARARPGRVKGLVGVAAAPDFTVRMWNDELTAVQRAEISERGFVKIPTEYGDQPYTITKALIEDGWNNRVIAAPMFMDIPVRLIQGMADAYVPWQTALEITRKMTGDDVELTLVPHGDHRLSTPKDLKRLCLTVKQLADQV